MCCNSRRVRNYPEICCEDSDEDEDCIDACRKAPPYCVSRRGCFSTFGGIEFIFIVILAVVAFLGAAILIGYYVNTYSVGMKWRKLSQPESEMNEASMNMHSFLETVGFITLLGIAIALFRVSNCCDRAGMRVIHLVVTLFAGILIWTATYLAYEIKEHEKKKHFFSAHSWMGLLAITLFLAEVIFGIFKFIILLACGPISCCLRASCRPIHAAFGIGAFWAAVATAVAGMIRTMMSKAQKMTRYSGTAVLRNRNVTPYIFYTDSKDIKNKRVYIANAYISALILSGILVTYAVLSRLWGRR